MRSLHYDKRISKLEGTHNYHIVLELNVVLHAPSSHCTYSLYQIQNRSKNLQYCIHYDKYVKIIRKSSIVTRFQPRAKIKLECFTCIKAPLYIFTVPNLKKSFKKQTKTIVNDYILMSQNVFHRHQASIVPIHSTKFEKNLSIHNDNRCQNQTKNIHNQYILAQSQTLFYMHKAPQYLITVPSLKNINPDTSEKSLRTDAHMDGQTCLILQSPSSQNSGG